MAIEKEAVFEFNRMVIEHIKVLWMVGGFLVLLDINILAYVVKLRQARVNKWVIRAFLVGSLGSGAVSLVAGYLAESSLIGSVEDFAQGKEWVPGNAVEMLVAVQMIAIAVGIFIFVVACGFYWSSIAEYIMKHGLGKKGAGDDEG